MTVARSVAEILTDRVTLEIESIDRGGLVLPGSPGYPFASSALMDPISKDFVGGLHRMCRDLDVPMIDFVKGQRKDDVALEYLAEFTGAEGVLFVGRAQENTRVFRTILTFRTSRRRIPGNIATRPS